MSYSSDIEKQDIAQVSRIATSNHPNGAEILHIGDTKVFKDDFIQAFGGTLNPGLTHAPSRKFANPAPLGLSAFALTTFILSLTNVQARGVSTANVNVGIAFFYGGLIQLLAGMWEFVMENTFGATVLSSYGGFWMSWAAINVDAFGIVSAYKTADELHNALGFFLIAWFIFTTLMTICTIRSTVAFFMTFLTVDLAFLMLACAEFTGKVALTKAGGYLGLFASFFAWYCAFAGVANKENSYINVRPLYMPGAHLKDKA